MQSRRSRHAPASLSKESASRGKEHIPQLHTSLKGLHGTKRVVGSAAKNGASKLLAKRAASKPNFVTERHNEKQN
jgi:hypothetical protein